jgi:hypothetical protein
LEQTNVGAQVLLKQRFVTQVPTPATTEQISLSAHWTPSHGPSGRQKMLHTVPAGHAPVQGVMSTQFPLEQNCPASQTLFRHRLGLKQPGTQCPLTHVSWLPQVTPLHGSVSGTQAMLQPSPVGQMVPPSPTTVRHSSV